jgi:hypothetical protein
VSLWRSADLGPDPPKVIESYSWGC